MAYLLQLRLPARVGVVLGLLLAGLAAAPPASEAAGPQEEPPCAVVATGAEAARCGTTVEDLSQRTERGQVFANPDGTLTSVQAITPQRVRTGGGWRAVDTSLHFDADGSVVPGATTADVRFSGGGSAPLVTLGERGTRVRLAAPWRLPAPVLSGDTATYPEVLPGVDLQVRAEPDGFSQLLVVKNARAAADPALTRLRFGIDAEGGAVRKRGGVLEVVDTAGKPLFQSGSALMWDSGSASTGEMTGADAVRHRVEKMAATVTETELTVTPVADMLRGEDTKFPLYIDPTFSKPSPANWTHVTSCDKSGSYYTQYRSGMRVGRKWNESCIWRTFMQFDIGQLNGAKILGASLKVTADHVAACGGYKTQLWQTRYIGNFSSYTWNTAADDYLAHIDTKQFAANESSCPDPDQQQIFDEAGTVLDAKLQSLATANTDTVTLGLKSSNESDHYGWSYFLPNSVALAVTYNHTPTAPTALQITGDCGSSCATSGAQVRSGKPTLQAIPDDPNGGTLSRVEFEVYDQAGRTVQKALSGGAVSNRAVDQAASWQVSADLPEGGYSWRVRGCDAYLCGAYSAWFDFTVDKSPPTGLTVSSTAYPPKSSGVWSGGVGQAGAFTAAAAGASKVELTLNGVNKGWFDAPGGTWTGSLTPDREGPNVLSVRAADPAGNTAASAATYEFLVRPATTKTWVWGFDESGGTTAASVPGDRPLTVAGTAARTAGRAGTSAVALNGSTAWTTITPVLDTRNSFTVTAWVKLMDTVVSGPVTAVSADGPDGSGFLLQYRADLDQDGDAAPDPAWCFTMMAAGGTESRACSTESVGAGWVHLAGVHDQAGGRIRLYVNGDNFDGTDVASFAGGWSANDGWAVGRAKQSGVPAQFWPGAVDRVAAYQRALTQGEISFDGSQA
ncbi:LamG domain-containing protein [Nonomuraea turcica]|uniref:LamG domain-containing protein n=1 Tax=Nonomuraea sp. G32 TaxID=3067274 RepID=UPI00273B156A|nr:LamG domain-containing protein [Nonomuraea sp. G32]MDP4509369.1 LamG domain-containing protein [Nonomuraea sp. G32]